MERPVKASNATVETPSGYGAGYRESTEERTGEGYPLGLCASPPQQRDHANRSDSLCWSVSLVIDPAEYTLETLGQDGEFILYRGLRKHQRDASLSSIARLDTCDRTPRPWNAQKNRARLLLKGGSGSTMGGSAPRPHTTPGPEHAPARGSWRRAPRCPANSADGVAAVFVLWPLV